MPPRGCLSGGALVSSAPTKQDMHQQSKTCTNRAFYSVGAVETTAPP